MINSSVTQTLNPADCICQNITESLSSVSAFQHKEQHYYEHCC